LLGTRLAAGDALSVCTLAPRLRQILLCLFEGDSEKQIAPRLGISRHTIHEYLRRLHQTFEVNSRGQLLARCAPYLPVLRQIGEEASNVGL
jgi:DNA-binding NarL/FixJ family response regulator